MGVVASAVPSQLGAASPSAGDSQRYNGDSVQMNLSARGRSPLPRRGEEMSSATESFPLSPWGERAGRGVSQVIVKLRLLHNLGRNPRPKTEFARLSPLKHYDRNPLDRREWAWGDRRKKLNDARQNLASFFSNPFLGRGAVSQANSLRESIRLPGPCRSTAPSSPESPGRQGFSTYQLPFFREDWLSVQGVDRPNRGDWRRLLALGNEDGRNAVLNQLTAIHSGHKIQSLPIPPNERMIS